MDLDSDEEPGKKILIYIASFSGFLFLIYIYLILNGKTSFANCDLYFELRFTGFGLNPNQLAFTCVPIPFLALSIYKKPGQTKWMKFWMLIVLLSTLTIGLISLSDALIVSWIFGCGVLYYCTTLRGLRKMHIKVIITRLSITLLILCICFLFLQRIQEYAKDTYGDGVSNDQGSIRLLLWKNALKVFTYSPIFGLGPGSYSGSVPFGKEEAHNSFLDWMVSTGIIGAFLLLYLLFYKWIHFWRQQKLEHISIFVALITFAMFHLVLRHLFFWTLILFL
jgi:O-antigen ligase